MSKTAAFHNLGCKVNEYETEAMQQLLEEVGYQIVDFNEKADVYIINTCSVTGIADRKSRQMIHRAKKLNPDAIVVACGCYVQTREEEAKADPLIDILIGNNQKNKIVSLIEAYEKANQKEKLISYEDIHSKQQEYEKLSLQKTVARTRAFIKVQDGCDQFCSYCIIPFARGRSRSRELSDIVDEASRLSDQGYQEIVLTGIHLSSYGMCEPYNIAIEKETKQQHLLDLIHTVANVEGVRRIRLGSIEPQVMTEDFVRELAEIKEVCPQFHLSLQSGCDETLKRMNRKYSCEEYKKSCEILRKYFKNPAITTDVIVGFCGETDEEFLKTKAFVESIGFAELHIFKYSKRLGTKAYDMPNQLTGCVKTKRSEELFALEKKMTEAYVAQLSSQRVEALLETKQTILGREYFTGYTKEYIRVAVPSEGHTSNEILTGTLGQKLSEGLYELC